MARLVELYGLAEMARTPGSLSTRWRQALERARQQGSEFSVQEFCDWLKELGAENAVPASVGTALKKLAADAGERPSNMKPLIVTQQGRRGAGSVRTLFKYVFDGTAGVPKADPSAKKAKPADDEIPFDDEDDDTPDQQPAAKASGKAPHPAWLPKPKWDGDAAEAAMDRLNSSGLRPDDEVWQRIAATDSDVGANSIIQMLPPQYRRAAVTVAKGIFQNLNKDWDGSKAQAKQEPKNDPIDDLDIDDEGEFLDPDDDEFMDVEPDDEEEAPDSEPKPEPGAGAQSFLKPDVPSAKDEPKPASAGDRFAAIQHLARQKQQAQQRPAPNPPNPQKKSAGNLAALMKKFKR